MRLHRRRLIQAAFALAWSRFAAGAAARAAEPLGRPAFAEDPFQLGVASGDPSQDGAVLWTRLTGAGRAPLQAGSVTVAWEVSEDEGFRRIVRAATLAATPELAHAVHVEVRGLRPGRPYWYRFHAGRATSETGRSFTVPERPERLKLALTSCQHWEQGYFAAYADMLSQGAELVLQVGDYIYEESYGNGPDVRRFDAPDPRDLDGYRRRYALYRTDPHLRAAHAQAPFVVTWDDHEVENDYSGPFGVEDADPQVFLRRRAAAYQAYFEHMPLRASARARDGAVRLYRRLPWGDLATFHVLDTRQNRSAHACATPAERAGRMVRGCAEADDPARTMMGAAQEAWLKAGLGEERAAWTFLAQQTLFSPMRLPGGGLWTDIWDGYGATRARTLAALRQPAVRNPVVLGGDLHSFWVCDAHADPADPRSPVVAAEFVGTCLAAHNAPEDLLAPVQGLNPHVRFLDNSHAGYVLLDLRRDRLDADLRVMADMRRPDSPASSLARYVVEAGLPGAQRG